MPRLIDDARAVQHMSPFSGNLFEVRMFGRDEDAAREQYEFSTARLFCTSVSFGSYQLTPSDRHNLTREFLVEDVSFQDTITITWHETHEMHVWNYHRAWLGQFYDRSRDMFISGAAGKKRRAEIIINTISPQTINTLADHPRYNEGVEETSPNSDIQHRIELRGMIPTAVPGVDLGWDQTPPATSTRQITYHVDRILYRANTGGKIAQDLIAYGRDPWTTPTATADDRTQAHEEGLDI